MVCSVGVRVVVGKLKSIRSRVPAPPYRCGRFPPSKRELHEGFLIECCDASTSAVPKRERPVGRGVSLHVVWPRTAHIPGHQHHVDVATECKDTPEVERMTSLEPVPWPWRGRALPTELHPQKVQDEPSASTEAVLRQLVKERPPRPAVRSIDRRPAPMRRPVGVEKRKRPGSFRSPGLCVQRFEGAQLRASLSRMHSVLAPIKLQIGRIAG